MAETPWHAAFPAATSKPSHITSEDLHARLSANEAGLLVIDTRRTDFEDAFIKGAINLPAHSFYPTLPGLVPVLSKYETVVFHCQRCVPGSRGDRTAAWYQDALNDAGITTSKALVLEGGIQGWLVKYKEDGLTIKLV
ncbi:Rhodanese-like protein [Cylindrobasidium torrendii FP15055 ss-10]|uniref:Rhodanese-like protein n=1 Tax=Cylindrobasidium torrendii FP15055 ss-10 TaxID=1314674 RepID=A0A0D7BMP8_9AGAR|nr:Rhodanese-like protein [Cylindrobasidium torrendii FP15055 ss-10]